MSFSIDILGNRPPVIKMSNSKMAENEIVALIKKSNLDIRKITGMNLFSNGTSVDLILFIKNTKKKMYRLKSIKKSLKAKKKPMLKRVLDRLHEAKKTLQVEDDLFTKAISVIAKRYSEVLLKRGAVFYKYRNTNYVVLVIKENVYEVMLFNNTGMCELKSKHVYTGKAEYAITNFM